MNFYERLAVGSPGDLMILGGVVGGVGLVLGIILSFAGKKKSTAKLLPAVALILVGLGVVAYGAMKQPDNSVEGQFKRAIALADPAKASKDLIEICFLLENGKLAMPKDEAFIETLMAEMKKRDIRRVANLGRISLAAVEMPGGAALAEKIAPKIADPDAACETYSKLGLVTAKAGDKDKAKTFFKRAIELAVKSPTDIAENRIENLGTVAESQTKAGFTDDANATLKLVDAESAIQHPPLEDPRWIRRLQKEVAIWRARSDFERSDKILKSAWAKLTALPASLQRGLVINSWVETITSSIPEYKLALHNTKLPPGKVPTDDPKPKPPAQADAPAGS